MSGLPGELVNHLWQSTLCAGVVGLLALVLRSNSAEVRYRLWFAASIKFLIPFSLLVHLGSGLGWPASPPSPGAPAAPMKPIQSAGDTTSPTARGGTPTSVSFADAIAEPLAMAVPIAAPATSIPLQGEWSGRILAGVMAVWAIGVAFNAVSWLREWMRARRRLRTAVQLDVDVPARIPALSSPAAIEPSVFGIFRPVLLLPENILDDLTPAQVESILLHESAHVDRRDNLAAAIHMVVESLFWFNPAVWWIGTRLIDERERACDEAVLRRFDEPGTYAEAILSVCKLHLKTPLACAAGIASSNLRERIEAIMNHRQPWSLDLSRRLLIAAVAVAVACGPMFAGMVSARQLAAAPAAQESRFTFFSIIPPGATSATARGINNVGRIVGSFADGHGTHGFVYGNGAFTTIDVPGSTWTIATGINNAGQIVGAYGTGADMGNHGFLLSAGSFSSFDYPGSLDTIANGINNKGQIVGTYLGSDGLRHGFLLSGGTYTRIEVPESGAGSAEGINDSGQIVGLSGDGATAAGFVLTGNRYTRIQPAPDTFATVRAVNNLGDVAGQDGGPEAPFRGFLHSGGRYVPMSLPGNPFAWNVHGVNDLGQIVGAFTDQSGGTFGYLATPTAFTAPLGGGDSSAPGMSGLVDPGSGRAVADLQGPQGPRGPEGPQGPPGPPGRAGSGRGDRSPGSRGLHAVRSALQRSNGALGRGGPGNLFAQRARAAVGRAIDNATAAIAYVEAHPETAAVPAVPPKATPAFEPPASERGRYPGRQIPLNNLEDAFERLAAQPGGDLGGLRARMYDEIAAAANETIADIVVTARKDDLERIAGSLRRTAANVNRVGPGSDVHAQRAAAAIQTAIDGIHAAIAFIHEHPAGATGQPAAPDVLWPAGQSVFAGERRYPGREAVLRGLSEAYTSIASLPGGDFGGLRSRIQNAISVAIVETIAGINAAAERDRERREPSESRTDGLRFQ